uniref:Uncharacterized protein n=1 Tax=Oncorhynchus tshawytscha TaxID=74940 RepID=A0AAZ3RKN4_ONCTS
MATLLEVVLLVVKRGKDRFTVSHLYADIHCQKISPDGKAKIQLQLSTAMKDRDAAKDDLQHSARIISVSLFPMGSGQKLFIIKGIGCKKLVPNFKCLRYKCNGPRTPNQSKCSMQSVRESFQTYESPLLLFMHC